MFIGRTSQVEIEHRRRMEDIADGKFDAELTEAFRDIKWEEIIPKKKVQFINLDELDKRIKALGRPTPMQVIDLITTMYKELPK